MLTMSFINEKIESLKEKINREFKKCNKNTIYNIQAIDAEALAITLETESNIDKVELNYFKNDIDSDCCNLKIYYSRYAMDGNGSHVGYENIIFKLTGYKKSDFNLPGIPYIISEFIVFPDQIEIVARDLPKEEIPTFASHKFDCINYKIHNPDDWEDCDCLDCFNGYYPPDDDFFYEEINYIINDAIEHLPEAIFDDNGKDQIWILGSNVYNMNKMTLNGKSIKENE